VADPEILIGEGAQDSVSASPSFIANAHKELYAFYTGKGGLLKKKSEPTGGGPIGGGRLHAPFPIFKSATG